MILRGQYGFEKINLKTENCIQNEVTDKRQKDRQKTERKCIGMKQIKNYKPAKYDDQEYQEIEPDIYKIIDEDEDDLYVTTLSFIQEPELGEGANASDISQYPLEDILDRFYCHVSDFYEEENQEASPFCILEFASPELQDVVNLRSMIGKHVYNREENGNVILVIE